MRSLFAQMRRSGFDTGVSAGKLAAAMVEVLSQLPPDAPPSKEIVLYHLGFLGQMSSTRDIAAAWNTAKKRIVKEQPGKFYLDGKILRWTTDAKPVREKLSAAGQRKLEALAAKEGLTPDELVGSLVACWRAAKK